VGGWLETKRNLGELDLFVPLAQDNRTLFFTDLRFAQTTTAETRATSV